MTSPKQVEGKMAVHGGRLNRIVFPETNKTKIIMGEREKTLQQAIFSAENAMPRKIDPSAEIGLDLNVPLTVDLLRDEQLSLEYGYHESYIPKTMHEVHNMIHLVTVERSGSINKGFNISELRKIANNLDISARGNRQELAMRIIKHVRAYFDEQRY